MNWPQDTMGRAFHLICAEVEQAGFEVIELNLFNNCRELEMVAKKHDAFHVARLSEPKGLSWREGAYHDDFGGYPAAGQALAERLKQ
jgi:hypothetical protein